MFRKLLKYDLMSVWRTGWGTLPVMLVCTLLATVAANFLNRLVDNSSSYALPYVVCTLLVVLGLFGVMASVVAICILAYMRFYKNLFTDEGYLTFTLPVKRSTLLMSKTVNSAIWMASYVLLLIFCLLFFFAFGGFDMDVIGDIGRFISDGISALGGWTVLYVIAIAAFLVSGLFFSISVLHFSIATGTAITKKAKVLGIIGIYYLSGVVTPFVLPLSGLFGIAELAYFFSLPKVGHFSVILVIILLALIYFGVGLVFYFMTLDRMSRKLNLE